MVTFFPRGFTHSLVCLPVCEHQHCERWSQSCRALISTFSTGSCACTSSQKTSYLHEARSRINMHWTDQWSLWSCFTEAALQRHSFIRLLPPLGAYCCCCCCPHCENAPIGGQVPQGSSSLLWKLLATWMDGRWCSSQVEAEVKRVFSVFKKFISWSSLPVRDHTCKHWECKHARREEEEAVDLIWFACALTCRRS